VRTELVAVRPIGRNLERHSADDPPCSMASVAPAPTLAVHGSGDWFACDFVRRPGHRNGDGALMGVQKTELGRRTVQFQDLARRSASIVFCLGMAASLSAADEDRTSAPNAAKSGPARPDTGSRKVNVDAANPAVTPRVVARPAAGERIAAVDTARRTAKPDLPHTELVPSPSATAANPEPAPIERAKDMIGACRTQYQAVSDYTCTFYKRERINGKLTEPHIMTMKVRTRPNSVYLKFQQPARGREAIYVTGRNGGRLLAHDVGINKLLAGTLELEPTSARAMENCRHPITEAGIGPLLDTIAKRWSLELSPEESAMAFRDDLAIGPRPCKMIESVHPNKSPHFLHYRVRVYIDRDLGLPIRFEAYDWPRRPQLDADLTEEYTYTDLKLNVGLTEADFDSANSAYSFGRF
jgi:hypothetical protein